MPEPITPLQYTPDQKESIAYGRCVQIYRSEGNTEAEIAELLKDHPGRPTHVQVKQAANANASAKPLRDEQRPAAMPPVQPLTPAQKRKLAAEAAKQAATTQVKEEDAPPPIASLPPEMAGGWDDEGAPPASDVPTMSAE